MGDNPKRLIRRLQTSSGCLVPAHRGRMFFLIRVHVPRFELHRWMDGIAVTLVALAAGFALVVQPAAEHKTVGVLATLVAFSYPVLDVLLIGAVLGVYGLLAWRPDTMWILVGLAVPVPPSPMQCLPSRKPRPVLSCQQTVMTLFGQWECSSLRSLRGTRSPDAQTKREDVTGMRAVALALFAEALAIGIQIYAVFGVGKSERIVTIVVLLVASVQIILTRPRSREDDLSDRPNPSNRRRTTVAGKRDGGTRSVGLGHGDDHPPPPAPRARVPLSTYNAPMAIPVLAQQERKTLCDLFVEHGRRRPRCARVGSPPTWQRTLSSANGDPISGPGLVWPALADYTDKVRRAVRDRTPYLKLVETVRRGPPLLLRPFDGPMNTVEFFIHVEDVRRAQDGWEPRALSPALADALWAASGLAGWPRRSPPRSSSPRRGGPTKSGHGAAPNAGRRPGRAHHVWRRSPGGSEGRDHRR